MKEADSPERILGIDLGTTNSLVAVTGPHGPRVLGRDNGMVPSVVAVLPDGTTLVGQAARSLAFEYPDRVVHSVKRLIGRSLAELRIEAERLPYRIVEGPGGQARIRIPLDGQEGRGAFHDFSPEEISALVLAEVHRRGTRGLGIDPDEARRVIITVPAYFDEAQRQATKQAAELAGLEAVRLVNEPTAAALAYGLDRHEEGTVVVYDLGGGTFDVSVLRIKDGVFRVLATHGDTQLGGDDFDRRILNRVLERIHAASGADVGSDAHVLATLRRSAEGLKIRLTYAELAELEIDMGGARPLEFRLSREELDELIRPDVERTMRSVEAALRDAELGRGQIDGILLVGGSTRIPLVRRLLEERFGMEPRSGVNPDLAVALGAATQAGILAGSEQELLLLDVVPLSLGLETLGGAFSKLILRNATLPCSVTEEFSTQADNQTGIDLNIYQGERELIQDCRQIASFKLSGIPPMPAGLARVAVTFAIDANGLLRVTARELRSGQTASVEVEPTLGLGKDEVRELVSESIQKAEEDFVARELLELRNSARALVRGTRQVLARGGADGLAPEQSYAIRKALAKLDGLEETGEGRELHEAVERLSSLTVQLADDMIGASVRKALEGSAVSEEERHGR